MRKQGPRLSLALGGKPGAPRCQSLTITEGKRPRVTTHAGGRPSTEGGGQMGDTRGLIPRLGEKFCSAARELGKVPSLPYK